MQASRLHDLTTRPPQIAIAPLDLAAFEGTWLKTNDATQWIRSFEITSRDGALLIHPSGDGGNSPDDWGTARASSLYANAIDSITGAAFAARYDFDTMTCELQGNVNLGLLVVACFTRFRFPGTSADCFTREFFHRV